MSDAYRVLCLSTAISPITHMSGVEGNEAILNRQVVMTDTGRRQIPILSGNAIRHRAVREPLAMHLFEACGIGGQISRRAANFFLHGGALSESTTRVDLTAKLDMQAHLPFIRLLGGALPASIEEGSLRCDQGVLVCRENAARIRAMSGLDVPDNLRPAEDFVGGWQYTRSDAAKTAPDMIANSPDDDPEAKSNLMIYAGQQVIPGAMFLHGFVLEHSSEIELGGLLLALSLWQQAGGTLGGMAAKGHGRLDCSVLLPDGIDSQNCMDRYIEHVATNVAWIANWCAAAFTPKPEKTDKPRKPKPGKKPADKVIHEAD